MMKLWPLLRAQQGSGGCSLPWFCVSSSDWGMKLPCAASEPTATASNQKLGHVTRSLTTLREMRISLWSKEFPQGAVTWLFPASSVKQSASSRSGAALHPTTRLALVCTGSRCPRTARPGRAPATRRARGQGSCLKGPRFKQDSTAPAGILRHTLLSALQSENNSGWKQRSQPNPSWGSLSIHQTGLLLGTIPRRWAINEVTHVIHALPGSPLQLWLLSYNYIYNPMTSIYGQILKSQTEP